MSKSFKDMSDSKAEKMHFRVVEVEVGRMVKRTYSDTNKMKDVPLESDRALFEACTGFDDLPF